MLINHNLTTTKNKMPIIFSRAFFWHDKWHLIRFLVAKFLINFNKPYIYCLKSIKKYSLPNIYWVHMNKIGLFNLVQCIHFIWRQNLKLTIVKIWLSSFFYYICDFSNKDKCHIFYQPKYVRNMHEKTLTFFLVCVFEDEDYLYFAHSTRRFLK